MITNNDNNEEIDVLGVSSLVSLLFCAAIFGFFYAWTCSTMWGLDAADPIVAIAAMQSMNASVRNAVFFPAFFCTPFVLIATSLLAYSRQRQRSAVSFLFSAVVYLCGAFFITMLINVPMNEALAMVAIPHDTAVAQQIWQSYSGSWQVWNVVRTIASGTSLLLAGYAILHIEKNRNN